MIKFISTFLLIIFYLTSIGQNIKSTDIPGKWFFNNYTETVIDKVVERKDVKMESIYVFAANGTYRHTIKENSEIFVTVGKWKVVDKGAKVRLYNNVDVPDDTSVEIGDHVLAVQHLNNKYYLTYTYGDVLNGPRTDYYLKSK